MIVVVYLNRDTGIEVERAVDTQEQARTWVAENPLHIHDDGVYTLWEVEPFEQPTQVDVIGARLSREMAEVHRDRS